MSEINKSMFIDKEFCPELFEDIKRIKLKKRSARVLCLANLFCELVDGNPKIETQINEFNSTTNAEETKLENDKESPIRIRPCIRECVYPKLYERLVNLETEEQSLVISMYATGWLMLTRNGLNVTIGNILVAEEKEEEKAETKELDTSIFMSAFSEHLPQAFTSETK